MCVRVVVLSSGVSGNALLWISGMSVGSVDGGGRGRGVGVWMRITLLDLQGDIVVGGDFRSR